MEILVGLCGSKVASWFLDTAEISITTQLTFEESRPDIVIQIGSDRLVFIEVKHDSGLGVEQLERYHTHLGHLAEAENQLVLLTRSRHAVQETSLDQQLFHHVCWYEISGWLSEADLQDEVTQFVVE